MKILKIYIINIYMRINKNINNHININNKKWIIINNNNVEVVCNKIMT